MVIQVRKQQHASTVGSGSDKLAYIFGYLLAAMLQYTQEEWLITENPQYVDADGQFVAVQDGMPESSSEVARTLEAKDQMKSTTPEQFLVREQGGLRFHAFNTIANSINNDLFWSSCTLKI